MVIGQSSIKTKDKTQVLKDLGITPPKAEETTPIVKEPTPGKTYTEEDIKKITETAIHDALMKAGRDWKTIELERDALASQLKDIKSANDKLTLQVDDLASENPDKFNVVKKNRELDEQEQRIKQERQTLETDKQSHQETVKLANETLREIAIWDIVEGFEGGDAEKLKALADTMGTKTEDISKIAETLWKPKAKTPEPPSSPELKLDSGITVGGLSEATIRENYRNNPNDPKAKAEYLAWRRKKGI